jgi:hypothetical protein
MLLRVNNDAVSDLKILAASRSFRLSFFLPDDAGGCRRHRSGFRFAAFYLAAG